MTRVRHDPRECTEALAGTSSPVVVDLETTGLDRSNQIVSAGLLVDGVAHILFARSVHASISNVPLNQFRDALRPLERPDLVVVGHNLSFDLAFLRREGIRVTGKPRDTLRLLRLIDQDRGRGSGGQDKHKPRIDLRAPPDSPLLLDYKLKHVAGQLLGMHMPYFPGHIELAPYDIHARYLACDLAGTKALHDYLWPKLTDVERHYHETMVASLIPILLDMNEVGVAADSAFIRTESQRLEEAMARISEEHRSNHGLALGMDEGQMRDWLFKWLKLPVLKKKRQGKQWVASLDAEAFRRLQVYNQDVTVAGSLTLIGEYRQAASLLVRLRSLLNHIDPTDGRIHSSFDDRQATGRVASTKPNLQQLAKLKTIAGQEFRSRNALIASPGYELAVFDIGQADIRALAHAVESFGKNTEDHQADLRQTRREAMTSAVRFYDEQRVQYRNPNFVGGPAKHPEYDPNATPDLAADFQDTSKDFYSTVVRRILGRDPVNKKERNRFKVVILSLINGQGPPSLSKALDCTEQEAKQFLQSFDRAYPKVAGYKWLMNWQTAFTGQTYTFMGRTRTMTAHRWLVNEPQVEILVSGKRTEPCWVQIVPLQPRLRVLTSYVEKAWNGDRTRLIYDSARGRLSQRPYHLFKNNDMEYFLPVRNWGWRSIRRVRVRGEEAAYEGFDATARAAFNFICQGGTADICKLMMLRAQPICRQIGARLLIQIHDELVFEVPKGRATEFIGVMKNVLEEQPTPDFKVPIVVEPKRGMRFGELVGVT